MNLEGLEKKELQGKRGIWVERGGVGRKVGIQLCEFFWSFWDIGYVRGAKGWNIPALIIEACSSILAWEGGLA